jgi:hypothetical protein
MLGFQQYAIPLSNGDVKTVDFFMLRVYPIYLDDGHIVLVEMQVNLRERGHIYNSEEVCLARLDIQFGILSVVQEG